MEREESSLSDRFEEESLWQDMPLQLEAPQEESAEVGEETTSHPAGVLGAEASVSRTAAWVGATALGGGIGAIAFAVAAAVLAFLGGRNAGGWKGALLTFDAGVVLLVLWNFLRSGTPVRKVGHWTLSLSGFAASVFVIQAVVVRSAVRFVHGATAASVLTELFTLGMVGAGGIVIFVQCFRRRHWAQRAGAVVGGTFPLVVALLLASGAASPGAFALRIPPAGWGAAAVVLLGAAAFALLRGKAARREESWRRVALFAGPLVAVALGAGFLTYSLASGLSATGAAHQAWALAAASVALGALPLLVAGIVEEWRPWKQLAADAAAATQFLWILVTLGVLALLAGWLAVRPGSGLLRGGLLAGGILSLACAAWFGARPGDWAARWALVPVGGAALAALCGLKPLLDYSHEVGLPAAAPWTLVAAFAWWSLVVGLALATAGLAIKRQRDRLYEREDALWADLGFLCVSGLVVAGAGLAAAFAVAVAEPGLARVLAAGLETTKQMGGDVLRLSLGDGVGGMVLWPLQMVGQVLPPAGLIGVLTVVLGIHLTALCHSRLGVYTVAVLWLLPLALATAAAALFALRLLFPTSVIPADLAAPVQFLASSFAARLALLVVVGALLARLWQSVRSALELSDRQRLTPPELSRTGHPSRVSTPERNLAALIRVGLVLSSVSLVLALLLYPSGPVKSVIEGLGSIGGAWMHTLDGTASRAGRLATEHGTYAGSVLLILFVLVAVHYEAVRGRVAVYPLLAGVWSVLLATLNLSWALAIRATAFPVSPGRLPGLVITGLVLVVLWMATVAVWLRWFHLWRAGPTAVRYRLDGRETFMAAHSLGSVGMFFVAVAAAAALDAACDGSAVYSQLSDRLVAAAASAMRSTTFYAESFRLALLRHYGFEAGIPLALVSAGLLSLHLFGRARVRWARVGLAGVWAGVLVFGLGAAVFMLHQDPGTWSATRILVWLLLVGGMLRVLVAVCNARFWLEQASR